MDKRYQVFISSTFADLVEERRALQQAVLSLDQFPAGMELFPATDDDQWELIKSVIDDSDYYIIVVGGRYGSMNEEGISYTEMEFDYAVGAGIPVLAFVHSKPEQIMAGKTEQSDAGREKLEAFRAKVIADRHVKFWHNTETLYSAVMQSLVTEFKRNPREGWIRSDGAANPEVVLSLKQEVERLKATSAPANVENLQQGSDKISLSMNIKTRWNEEFFEHTVTTNWDHLFSLIGPIFMQEATDVQFKNRLLSAIKSLPSEVSTAPEEAYRETLPESVFETVKVQFFALGLIQKGKIKRSATDRNVYWALTEYGEQYLMKSRALKRK